LTYIEFLCIFLVKKNDIFSKEIFLGNHNFFLINFSLFSSYIYNSSPENRSDLHQIYKLIVKSGELCKKEGNFCLAFDIFERALDLVKRFDNNKGEEVKCLINLGQLCWNLGQIDESSKKYRKALSIAKNSNLREMQKECWRALEIYRLYSEGKQYHFEGQRQKSIEIFQRAIELSRKSASKEHEIRCLRSMSLIYWELNNFRKYYALNELALTIAQSLNHREEQGNCLYNIGLYYWKLDDYSKALNYYDKAFIIAQKFKNKKIESACLTNSGIIYEKLGNYDKALENLKRALTIDQQLGDSVNISIDLNNIGTMFRAKGIIFGNDKDFYKALDYFNKCLRLTKKASIRKAEIDIFKKTEVQALNNIGTIHIDLEKYHNALKYLQLGYKKGKEIQDLEAIGMILGNMGIVHLCQCNYEEAIKSFQRAIEFANLVGARQILWEAYFGLGQCHEKRNEFSQAVKCYKKAIDIIDHIRSQISLDTYKAGFARDKIKVYELLINILYRVSTDSTANNYDREIFHIVEKAKARAFLESLGESKIDVRERLSPKLKKEEKEILGRISLVNQELFKGDLSKKRKEGLLIELQQVEDEYIRLISKMRVEIPEVADLVSPVPCQVEQVQKLLDGKTVLIEYFLCENQSVVFFITKNEMVVYPLPSRDRIEKSIKAYLKILGDSPKGKFRGSLAACRISQELLFSVENIPNYIENLIIIPDGVLYYLPFETLILHNHNKVWKNDYLIENYNISYVPSSSILLFLSKKKTNNKNPKSLLAFGNPSYTIKNSLKGLKYKTYIEILSESYLSQGYDISPLPYSEREILKISRYFPKKRRDIYLEEEAKEETIKKIFLKDYQIIHFACHGFLDEERPFRSALVLSLDGDSQEDGFLQVREIFNLRLNADLIVLSACQTGRGKLENGEGILGLPRIFFYVGAKSVVLTLWKINDESTSELMSLFYHYLSCGNNKAKALRLAKLKMINSKFCHPFYWAPFVLSGDSGFTQNFE